jgi:hypothetical protein
MRLRVSDSALLPELLAFLGETPDVVVDVVGDDEVEVSLVGSYAVDAMRMELYLRVRAWEAARNAGTPLIEVIGG